MKETISKVSKVYIDFISDSGILKKKEDKIFRVIIDRAINSGYNPDIEISIKEIVELSREIEPKELILDNDVRNAIMLLNSINIIDAKYKNGDKLDMKIYFISSAVEMIDSWINPYEYLFNIDRSNSPFKR